MRSITLALALLGTAGALSGCASSYGPPPVYVGANVEYVHRAPPPPRQEVFIEAPGPRENFVWDPGFWRWNGGEFVWVGGHWEPRRHGHWHQSHWENRPGGWVFIGGHW